MSPGGGAVDRPAAGALAGLCLAGAHVDAEQVDRAPDARRAMHEHAAHEGAGARLSDDDRAGLRERAGHRCVVQRVDQGTPEPVGEPAEPPREALAKGVGVEDAALRPGAGGTRDERALAGPRHAGDQKHDVGGIAEDHVRRLDEGAQAPVTPG